MRITHLALTDFRSYERLDLIPSGPLTLFVGPNATGKTNAIEAIEIVATGRSFRNPQWSEVVRWGSPAAAIEMSAEGQTTRADVSVTIRADGTKMWKSAGVVKRRQIDATRFVPVVMFTPDDLSFVKGPAEQRRMTIDLLGDQISLTYSALRKEYGRVIRQRNTVLRDGADPHLLESWDEQLIALGARLHVHRRRLLERVRQAAGDAYTHLAAGETLEMAIVERCGLGECGQGGLGEGGGPTPEEVGTALRAELSKRRKDELARAVSLVGPHRDDVTFTINGRESRAFGSQGQQRTIALAWKLAEVAVIRELLGRTPVLLLDDVMSELDSSRRHALTDLVRQDVQTFVTTTNTGYFDAGLLETALVVQTGST